MACIISRQRLQSRHGRLHGWMRRRRGYRRYPTDEPLETWVQYDEWARAGERYDQYCVRMAKQGEFGGGPEIIGLTQQDKISACGVLWAEDEDRSISLR